MDIPFLLTKYAPSLEWKFSEKENRGMHHLDNLVMLEGYAKPTKEQLESWDAQHKKETKDQEYAVNREKEYKKEIYPFMDNAKMLAELEGDNTKLDELKKKKKDIDDRFPKPEEQK